MPEAAQQEMAIGGGFEKSLERAIPLRKCPSKVPDNRYLGRLSPEINGLHWSDPVMPGYVLMTPTPFFNDFFNASRVEFTNAVLATERKVMRHVPIVLLVTEPTSMAYDLSRCERTTMDDALPAVLQIDASGFTLARATRFTEVNRETTDDV